MEPRLEKAKILVEQGKVDLNGDINLETPLKVAVDQDDLELARYLVSKGADPNAPRDKSPGTESNPALSQKLTTMPLCSAASKGNLQMVRLLIEAGADVNRPQGPILSPLGYAKMGQAICKTKPPCNKPYDAIIDLLTRSGAK